VASAGQQVVSAEEVREAVEHVFSEEGGVLMATLAQQWIAQGEQRGMLEEAREMVLRAVNVRFQVVPPDIEETVQRITTRATLASLHDRTITSETLDVFRDTLRRAVE